MNILIEGHGFLSPYSGVGNYAKKLVQSLSRHPKVHSLCLFLSVFPLGGSWRSSVTRIQNLRLGCDTPIRRIPLPLEWTLRLWQTLRQPKIDFLMRGFDVVHGPAYVLPPRSRIPGIVTIHDISVLEHPEWYPRGARIFGKQILMSLEDADAIIVPSEYVRQSLKHLNENSARKIHVLPHPVETDYTVLRPQEKIALRRRLLGSENPYMFWIGEMNPRKNLSMLLATLHGLRKRGNREILLVLAGQQGFGCSEIFRKAEKMGLSVAHLRDARTSGKVDIIVTGCVSEEDKKRLYSAAELFIFPSHEEGFGFPVIEAMASGVPVVCSNTGSLPEVAGHAAVFVDPSEGPEGFIDAATNLLENEDAYLRLKKLGLEREGFYENINLGDSVYSIYERSLSCSASRAQRPTV